MQPAIDALQPYWQQVQPYLGQGYGYVTSHLPESLPQSSIHGVLGGQVVTLLLGNKIGFASALAIASYPQVDKNALIATAGLYILPPVIQKVAVQVISTAIIETTKVGIQAVLFPFKAITWLVSSDPKLERKEKEIEQLKEKILLLEKKIAQLEKTEAIKPSVEPLKEVTED